MRRSLVFSLSHFIPKGKGDWKFHYFLFLCRYFFDYEGFPWWFTLRQFVDRWKKLGFNGTTLKVLYYDACVKENPFVEIVEPKNGKPFPRLRNRKSANDPRTVRITSDAVFRCVRDAVDFKRLCYAIVAASPSKVPKSSEPPKKAKDANHAKNVRSRTLSTIGKRFFGGSKSTVSKILSEAEKSFPFFKSSSRYAEYGGRLMRLSNVYSIKHVEYGYSRFDKNHGSDTDDGTRILKPRFLRKAKYVFGKKLPFVRWENAFVPRDAYEFAYANVFAQNVP